MIRSGADSPTLMLQQSPRPGVMVVLWRVRSVLRGAPLFSLAFLTLAIGGAVLAPRVAPYDPIQNNPLATLSPPSWQYLMGTDHLGRDILSRVIYGARISLIVGFLAVFVSGVAGTVIAMVSGVVKGWVDTVLMRLTDAFLSLPYLMVAVTVVSLLGPSLANVILVIGLLRWMTYARTIRGEVLQLTETDFVRLAHVAGTTRVQIIQRHILPNIVNTLLVLSTLDVASAVITEASLSFLGLGVPRPLPSWGTMLSESQTYVFIAWWMPVFPGVTITLLVMSINFTGDWLRDRLDPTRRQL
jgi:peptide/nickel transport system permease protein